MTSCQRLFVLRKSIFKAADGSGVHIVLLAVRSRFTKNAADAKLVENLAKHWRFSRAAAGTICTPGPSAALKIDFRIFNDKCFCIL